MKKTTFFIYVATIFLLLLSCITPFCNFYSDHFYGVLNTVIGTLTNPLPFALGEIIMYLGAIAILLMIVFSVIFIFLRKNKKYKSFFKGYSKSIALALAITLFMFTITWYIPFRADILKVSTSDRDTFTTDEIKDAYSEVVAQLNLACATVPRDSEGNVIFDYTAEDIFNAMRAQSETYSRLEGHYSEYKPAMCSDVLEWMWIGGYNYPFTMEPTLNVYCSDLYYPVLYSHELAHHKGYYRENEANFLSYICLSESDNPVLQYSAYIEIEAYLREALCQAIENSITNNGEYSLEDNPKLMEKYNRELSTLPAIDSRVFTDQHVAYVASEERYEENKNEIMEAGLKDTAVEVADTGWTLQGEVLQENSYDGVTLMLLQYYIDGGI